MGWRIACAAVAVLLVVGYAVGSGRWVASGSSWYLSLQQPAWQPPAAVFGLAWTYNFLALAVVGVLLALNAAPSRVATFLGVLAVSIVLAVTWAYLFYGPHHLVGAAIVLTLATVITTVPVAVAFAERPWWGWVLMPYQVWLVVATSLSWGYVALNRQ
jgi:tryptophan-rich sensory protein